ncbi:alpha/beta hydrolase family protein [Janthinobacterium agaricidamnosum]|uniref:PGAP1-like family protein n=1 Tax=Janthinobacterium agaricidamnosum NBRC 102515 = DSM 9628 TaxID=1349767 RepID=W0V5C6_9BURK|nr:alpha/beta hydrolase [Janthinobacterium agaricidamnosum]CDG83086.1 PGAP1-like family protein [Janthinobacterium agaricidamnosum NBRC 102515 = DSM 9628]
MSQHTRLPAIAATLLSRLALGTATAAPMTVQDYLALSGPEPTAHIAYGKAPSQFVEVFQPQGNGPFPVVLLVHGGCWTVEYAGIRQMRNMAGALAGQGIAVLNVEYRRADEQGGGYPGTYLDINAAIDTLEKQAATYRLDTRRVVAVGHSAGGQLVQWLAGRPRLPHSSPLYQAAFLPVSNIISLGGLADLRNEAGLIQSSCQCELTQLTGVPSPQRPDVFADTNAAELMPNGSKTVLITGELDDVSPPRAAHDYAARAIKAGDQAQVLILPGASHYDEVAVHSPSWPLILAEIRKALGI